MRKLWVLALSLFFMFMSQSSYAFFVIDTGRGPNTGGWAIDGGQYLAGKFTLDQQTQVTDVEGWMDVDQAGYLSFSIYGDGGSLPDFNNLFYREPIYLTPQTELASWYGLHNLNWELNAGNYWLSFERASIGFSATTPFPVERPLDSYAYYLNLNGRWTNYPLNIGVRLENNSHSVPEPATLLLLGLGQIVLLRRNRNGRFN